MLQTYILITNERLVASVAEANSLNVIKLIIPLRNIDNLVYDAGIQLKVMSKSNAYSIFTNSEDIELVRKTYYAYTQFKEKNETRELELKVNPPSTVSNTNKYDEIEKLSELFKKGIITQEEFDKKKTELLGL
jgi:predicted glutamine amidotransferase